MDTLTSPELIATISGIHHKIPWTHLVNELLLEKRKSYAAIMSHDTNPNEKTPDDIAFDKRTKMQLELMMEMIAIDIKKYPSITSLSKQELESIYESMAEDWSRKYSSIFSHLWNTSICEYDDLFVALLSIQANNKLLH